MLGRKRTPTAQPPEGGIVSGVAGGDARLNSESPPTLSCKMVSGPYPVLRMMGCLSAEPPTETEPKVIDALIDTLIAQPVVTASRGQ